MALLGLSLLMMMKRRAPWPLLWLVTLAGLADIIAMASIYCHASVTTWQHFLAHAVVPVTFPLQSLAAFDASAGLRLAGWCCSAGGALLLMVNLTRPHGPRSGQTTGCLLLLLGELLLRLAFFSIDV